MFTSAIKKTSVKYFIFTAFCFVFQLGYEHFSHGVNSNFMRLAFLIPLFGGVFTALILWVENRQSPSPKRIASQLFSGGVIWLTLGSLFQGVLEIYGTTNHLIVVFPVVGILQILISAFILLFGWILGADCGD